ncbi:MAG: hypothetical protein E7336_08365 [Clostridiales bacterium]|nr:hypothetical protein [Clostridiales bacterium]
MGKFAATGKSPFSAMAQSTDIGADTSAPLEINEPHYVYTLFHGEKTADPGGKTTEKKNFEKI